MLRIVLLPTTDRVFGWQQTLDFFGLKILDLQTFQTSNLQTSRIFLFLNILDKEYSAQFGLENFMTPPQGHYCLGSAQREAGSCTVWKGQS